MKNKQGFTLVELLAVIAILAILAGIATPIVLSVQKSIKVKMYNAKVKMIEEAAVLYAEKNNLKDKLAATNNWQAFGGQFVRQLCENNYLKAEKCSDFDSFENNDNDRLIDCCQINPVNNKPMGLCYVTIEYDPNTKRYTATLTQDYANNNDNGSKTFEYPREEHKKFYSAPGDGSYCLPE